MSVGPNDSVKMYTALGGDSKTPNSVTTNQLHNEPKGPEWENFKNVMVGRKVLRPRHDGRGFEEGVVRFPQWFSNEARGYVLGVYWDGEREKREEEQTLTYHSLEELTPWLLDAFLDSRLDVPEEILALQRVNWHRPQPKPQPKTSPLLNRGRRAAQSPAGTAVGGAGAPAQAVAAAAAPRGAKRSRVVGAEAADHAADAENADGGKPAKKIKPKSEKAGTQEKAAQGKASQEQPVAKAGRKSTGKAAAPAAHAATNPAPGPDSPAAQGATPRATRRGVPAAEGAGDTAPKSAPARDAAGRSLRSPAQPPGAASVPAKPSARNNARAARAAEAAATPVTKAKPGNEEEQEDYSDANKWVKSWTGKCYPRELVCKPGDKLAEDISPSEYEGDFEVECVLDEWMWEDDRWFLLKWKGYEVRIGTKPRTGSEWKNEAKGDWEPKGFLQEDGLPAPVTKWCKKRPEWYKAQEKK